MQHPHVPKSVTAHLQFSQKVPEKPRMELQLQWPCTWSHLAPFLHWHTIEQFFPNEPLGQTARKRWTLYSMTEQNASTQTAFPGAHNGLPRQTCQLHNRESAVNLTVFGKTRNLLHTSTLQIQTRSLHHTSTLQSPASPCPLLVCTAQCPSRAMHSSVASCALSHHAAVVCSVHGYKNCMLGHLGVSTLHRHTLWTELIPRAILKTHSAQCTNEVKPVCTAERQGVVECEVAANHCEVWTATRMAARNSCKKSQKLCSSSTSKVKASTAPITNCTAFCVKLHWYTCTSKHV